MMKNKHIFGHAFLLTMLSICFVACSTPQETAAVKFASQPTTTSTATPQTGDLKRTYTMPQTGHSEPYRLFVPSTYTSSKKYPLLVVLHDSGVDITSDASPLDLENGALKQQAEKQGFIVALPSGLSNNATFGNIYAVPATPAATATASATPGATSTTAATATTTASATSTAESGTTTPSATETTAETTQTPTSQENQFSEQDVLNVTGLALKDYSIDSNRVYLMGNGTGGAGALALAAKYPKMWTALSASDALVDTANFPFANLKPVPVQYVHGSSDNTVSRTAAQDIVSNMEKAGVNVTFDEVSGGNHNTAWVMALPQTLDFFAKHTTKSTT